MSGTTGLSPASGTVLVTGASGFVGSHVARALAAANYRVRGWGRRPPAAEVGAIEWVTGDLRDPDARARAVDGVAAVVHAGGWVSLGADPAGESRAVNVEATQALLEQSQAAGVGVFVFTSTLWTVAAGTAERPADEDTPWNLDPIRSPYCDTKRAAEALVLTANRPGFRTCVLCPGMVIGAGDRRPSSTGMLLMMARWPVLYVPSGGLPVVDARVVARAHVRALACAEPGRRYVVAGPYLSYRDLALLVGRVATRPRCVRNLPDALERPLRRSAGWIARWRPDRARELSAASVAGGFLRLHATGRHADAAFGLEHPEPLQSVRDALHYAHRAGLAPWLKLQMPAG